MPRCFLLALPLAFAPQQISAMLFLRASLVRQPEGQWPGMAVGQLCSAKAALRSARSLLCLIAWRSIAPAHAASACSPACLRASAIQRTRSFCAPSACQQAHVCGIAACCPQGDALRDASQVASSLQGRDSQASRSEYAAAFLKRCGTGRVQPMPERLRFASKHGLPPVPPQAATPLRSTAACSGFRQWASMKTGKASCSEYAAACLRKAALAGNGQYLKGFAPLKPAPTPRQHCIQRKQPALQQAWALTPGALVAGHFVSKKAQASVERRSGSGEQNAARRLRRQCGKFLYIR